MREQVTSALAPTRASAVTMSALRQRRGKGKAVMPARSTPRKVMTLSTVFGRLHRHNAVGLQSEPTQLCRACRDRAIGLCKGREHASIRWIGERKCVGMAHAGAPK